MDDIYHAGQLALQKITGEVEIAQRRIPIVRSTLHPKSMPFIANQVLAFVGSEDNSGDIWLSLLVGEHGFISVPSNQVIKFDLAKIVSNKEDIFFSNIISNPTVGLLFHEAERRARYRAWGIASEDNGHLNFAIRMGYPSCPKHIQRERIEVSDDLEAFTASYEKGVTLDEYAKEWILNAHTFFICTQTKKGDIEASHRGGNIGFIQMLENDILRVPDYFGNSMYSTLGNIYENPKAALLFIDYEKGETLQLTGKAELQFDQNTEDDLRRSGDTGRFWTFETKKWIRTLNHHKIKSEFIDFSHYNMEENK